MFTFTCRQNIQLRAIKPYMCEYDKDKYVFSVIKISSSSIFEYIIIMELVLGTSVYFSSSEYVFSTLGNTLSMKRTIMFCEI